MYIPSAFLETELPALHEMMRTARLANIITTTTAGLVATPVPLLLAPEEGPFGTLYGHLARANIQWTLEPLAEAMALFMGPDAYISPSWYASKQENHKVVPTWNYVAVHAYGPISFFEDAAQLRALVTNLTDHHEQGRAQPWAVTDAPKTFIDGLLKAIIGFKLPITRIDGKRKMSQNRPEKDRQGVAANLAQSPLAADREAGKLIPLSSA